MRKLLFVLLSIPLVAFTGCQSGKLPDAAVSSSPPASLEVVSGTSSGDMDTSGNSHGEDTSAPVSGTVSQVSESPDTSSAVSRTPTTSSGSRPAVPEQSHPTGSRTESSSPSTSAEPPRTESAPTPPPTSRPTDPATSQPPPTTSRTEPDMEAEYARIIREAVAYAEDYKEKGFTFVWDDSLEFGWESGAGWMGTPRVKYEGVDGTIEMLQYHIDKIVKLAGGPGNTAYYKVMQIEIDGDIAFVVLYS